MSDMDKEIARLDRLAQKKGGKKGMGLRNHGVVWLKTPLSDKNGPFWSRTLF